LDIRTDPLIDPQVIDLLQRHLDGTAPTAPPESQHALDLEGLRQADVTFWSIWDDSQLAGMGALKELTGEHGEIKSMRTADAYLRQGVGARMLTHIITEGRTRGYARLSLETGSMDYFAPARQMYASLGFVACAPFSDYTDDPNSTYMTLVF
jgi:putative acetyltransferase